MFWRIVLLVWVTIVAEANASVYSQFLDDGGWRADSSVFECAMTHTVPLFGQAVFATRAGEHSHFYLTSDAPRLAAGQALLEARSPIWSERLDRAELGYVAVKQSTRPVTLGSQKTEAMLAELYDGHELLFTRKPWYGAEVSSRVTITTVGFRATYQRYLDCLAGLLPANFDQIKRTAVYFGSNQFEDIRSTELRKLDNIIAYVKADPTVEEFYIDGHTDSVGSREDNLLLAENRAKEVMRYLVNKGVPEGAIVSRWHGERYPVANNETIAGRAKNRRVTIRLEKIEAPQNLAQ